MSTPLDLGPLPLPLVPGDEHNPRDYFIDGCYMLDVAAASQWRPIETAPKDGAEILVFAAGSCYVVGWGAPDFEWWCVDDNKHGPYPLRGSAPTHWMPLPAAPSEPTKEGG